MPYLPISAEKKSEIDAVVAEVAKELAPGVVFIRYDIEKDWSGDWGIFFRIPVGRRDPRQPPVTNHFLG